MPTPPDETPPTSTTPTTPSCPRGQHWEAGKGCVQSSGVPDTDPSQGNRGRGALQQNPDPFPEGTGGSGLPPGVCGAGETWKENGPQGPGCYATETIPGPTIPSPTGGPGGGTNKPTGTSAGGPPAAAAPTGLFGQAKAPGQDAEDLIWQHILDLLNGKTDPFSDERFNAMKGTAYSAYKGREKNRLSALDEDLISANMGRSGSRLSGRQGIRREEGGAYSQAVTNLKVQQEMERYAARKDALDRARNWLNDKRNYLLTAEDNDIKRQIGLAQVKLGYAKIASEENMLKLQLDKMGGGGGGGGTSIGGIPAYIWQLLGAS